MERLSYAHARHNWPGYLVVAAIAVLSLTLSAQRFAGHFQRWRDYRTTWDSACGCPRRVPVLVSAPTEAWDPGQWGHK